MTDNLIIAHVPSLVATLLNREGAKGSPLSRTEVELICDESPAIAMTWDQRAAVDKERGYDDIDPDDAWEEWQHARKDLIDV